MKMYVEEEKRLFQTKINQRAGHRAYVTRTIELAKNALEDFTEDTRDDLLGWKTILNDKLDVLAKLDEEILAVLTEAGEIEKEIVY